MAKKTTDIERITSWFQSAEPARAEVLFQVIKGILAKRDIETGNRKAQPKKTKTATAGKRVGPEKNNSGAEQDALQGLPTN